MTLICMKCGKEEYWTYRDFPHQKGIKKCVECGCEMIDPRETMERIIEEHREVLENLNMGSKKIRV